MDKYKDFSITDFLDDPDFLRWMTDPTPEDEVFWRDFLKVYPSKKSQIQEARLVFNLLQSRESKMTLSEQYELWNSIQQKSKFSGKQIVLQLFKYAAILVLVFFSGAVSYYYYQNSFSRRTPQFADLYPADGGAMVILADGSKVSLKKDMSEILYSENGDQLVVNSDTIKQKPELKEALNKVIVSYGKKSMIVLSDGTKVWLNAGSQLVYPAFFSNDTREVSLVGEAFFDVTKNPEKPFIVKASDVNIQVLGTRFDISAYPEDKIIQTVLEEGKINLKYEENGLFKRDHTLSMTPNQMVEFDRSSRETASSIVNVSKYVSWKEGMLEFEKVNLNKALKQIERFYNVNITLGSEQIGEFKLSGKLDLKNTAEDVLNVIKLTLPVNWHRKANGDYVLTNK
jgi:ferric-dicitrate binding protein FerR (iron transport regulator)